MRFRLAQKKWITAGVDGRIDPSKAVRALLSRPDAARLRSQFLASAFAEFEQARGERDAARFELAEARGQLDAARAEAATWHQRAAEAEQLAEQLSARVFELEKSHAVP